MLRLLVFTSALVCCIYGIGDFQVAKPILQAAEPPNPIAFVTACGARISNQEIQQKIRQKLSQVGRALLAITGTRFDFSRIMQFEIGTPIVVSSQQVSTQQPSSSQLQQQNCQNLYNEIDYFDVECHETGQLVGDFLDEGCMSQMFTPGSFQPPLQMIVHGPKEFTYYVDSDDDVNSDTDILLDLQQHLSEILSLNPSGSNPFYIFGFRVQSWTCNRGDNCAAAIYLAFY